MAYECGFCATASNEGILNGDKTRMFCDRDCLHAYGRQETMESFESMLKHDIKFTADVKESLKRVGDYDETGFLTDMYKERVARMLFHKALLARKPKNQLIRFAEALIAKKVILFNKIDENQEIKEEWSDLFYDIANDLTPEHQENLKTKLVEIWGV